MTVIIIQRMQPVMSHLSLDNYQKGHLPSSIAQVDCMRLSSWLCACNTVSA